MLQSGLCVGCPVPWLLAGPLSRPHTPTVAEPPWKARRAKSDAFPEVEIYTPYGNEVGSRQQRGDSATGTSGTSPDHVRRSGGKDQVGREEGVDGGRGARERGKAATGGRVRQRSQRDAM